MPMLASMCTRIPPTANERSSAARSRRPVALRRRLVAGVEHDRELVAAEPRQRVARPQRLLQARADLAQHLVAGVMAERVVELLEAVEVDQQQRDLAVGVLDRLAEPVQQVAAVAEPGQVVGDGLALAHAQAVDDRQPGARHPGQDGDRRQRGGDRREADELADDEQRERGRHVGQDRRQDDRAELRSGRGVRLVEPGGGDRTAATASSGSSPSAVSPTSAQRERER